MSIPNISIPAFLTVFLPTTLILLLVSLVVGNVHLSGQEMTLAAREEATLNLAEKMVLREFEAAASDLKLMKRGLYLNQDNSRDTVDHIHEHLDHHYRIFARDESVYEKISLINKAGIEHAALVRSSTGMVRTPASALLDVSKNLDFRRILSLNRGAIYISPIIRHSSATPTQLASNYTLRFGAPIYGANDELQGVLLLEMRLLKFLRDIIPVLNNATGTPMILSGSGRKIFEPMDSSEPTPPLNGESTFATENPQAWSDMSNRISGFVETKNHRYHFKISQPFLMSRNLLENSDLPGALDRLPVSLINYKIVFATRVNRGLTALVTTDEKIATAVGAGILLLLVAMASLIVARLYSTRNESDSIRRIAEQRQQLILETAGEGILGISSDGHVEFANAAAEELTGWHPNEMIGKHWRELLHGDVEQGPSTTVLRPFGPPLEDNETPYRSIDGSFLRKDGSLLPIAFTTTPITPRSGLNGAVMVFRDISERQRAEKQLNAAKEGAEAANHAKSIFLSSMSHELRTPLNAILGFGQVMQSNHREPLSEQQQESLKMMMTGGEHLLELINRILDLSQIEMGKISISLGAVSVCDVLEECAASVETVANSRRINIEIQGPSEGPQSVRADCVRLKQVLLNLVSNALIYNRDGGTIELAFREAGNNLVKISVLDTGIGIPAEKQSELFQNFNRLESETSSVEGAGIGLIIAKQLTEAMEGNFGFESTEGKGSTFWVEFPIATKTDFEDRTLN